MLMDDIDEDDLYHIWYYGKNKNYKNERNNVNDYKEVMNITWMSYDGRNFNRNSIF